MRRVRRWAWRCDCDGYSHLLPGVADDYLVGVVIDSIRTITGEPTPPPTCPWRAFSDPLMVAIQGVRSRKSAELDHGPMSLRLLDAVAYFERCFEAACAARREATK